MIALFDSFGRIDRHKRRGLAPDIAVDNLERHQGPEVSLLAFGNGKT